MRKLRVIVNAVPLATVNTGIGRYLRCLYAALERGYGEQLDIAYFDGRTVSDTPPRPPENLAGRSRLTSLLWKLPPAVGLAVRLARHWQREAAFFQAAKGYDIYHEAAFFPFRVPAGVATVFTVHDLSLLTMPERHPAERVRYFNRYFHKRLPGVARFLAVSKYTKAEMVRLLGLDPARIRVTWNAHEPEVFHPVDASLPAGVPERYFLFVGTNDPRKNLHVIPKALAAAGLSIPLVTAGWSGWSGERMEGTPPIEIGYCDDATLAALYSKALALVYPSIYEGFGLPVLEAMACRCPVVTTRLTSLPEVAGEAGIYLDAPSDPVSMGETLARVAGDDALRETSARLGLARSALFSWDETARRTVSEFEKSLERG
ncbi:hypothetical protein DVDV_3634 [Desulfovibrio sp. DV]|uniref:glycosyltransferase family 4 protein n=1 Tax=Desulfovibrio sp. DV TaxID=1844708 RepID=UPI00094BC34D|nr:glycosyltransferase family 1 protein [Desulfovibrio sp. DV]OLN25089.1 hypothetical protein DVDV_3634 [Desulfovibrio sp. DV]